MLWLVGLLLVAISPAQAAPIDRSGIEAMLDLAQIRMTQTLADLHGDTTKFPRAHGEAGKWHTVGAGDWTSGFFPGTLWLLYQATGETTWRDAATRWTIALASQAARTDTHDLGFVIGLSYGHDVALTGDPSAKDVMLRAAASLARRYSPATHAMRSFDGPRWQFAIIIDSLMNLGPWLWGAAHALDAGGDPAWRKMAEAHGHTVLASLMRPDGGTYHLADLDSHTGAVRVRVTYQGYSDTSVWSRGQAWAMHGFTTLYQATGDTEFLNAALRASDYFLKRLPEDLIPYWDFDAPVTAHTPRDSSAAAIAASALEMLCTLAPLPARTRYCDAALGLLGALASETYLAPPGSSAILRHATGPDTEIDTALIYADYYFVEALLRARDRLARN